MSIFRIPHRLQEANLDPNKGGGGGGNNQPTPQEWLKPFGDGGKAFEAFKEPAELVTKWGEMSTELTALKAKPSTFDWRKEMGGEDAEAGKMLARYADPKAFVKAHNEAVGKIRSGELAKPLAKDAKPEEVAAWRTANGIPAEPKGYFEKLPEGLVIGKDDQPAMDAWAKTFHEQNLPPAAAHSFIKQYYAGVAAMQQEEAAVDRADATKAVAELRTKWGNDFGPNMSILNNFLEGMGADLVPLFKDATLGDGTRLMNSPGAIEFLVNVARQANPLAHLLPASGEGGMQSLEGEIGKLQKMMADKSSEYWKGPNADKNQARYRDLVSARAQMKKS